MKQDFDLHIHTINSDGEYSVSEIIKKLREENIKLFSITDHDNIDSIEQVSKEDLSGLEYVSGIEISSIVDNKYKVHILGYFIDGDKTKLYEICNKLRGARVKRLYDMALYIKDKFNIDLSEKEINEVILNAGVPGRPHLAKLLIKKGFVTTTKEAFTKYLNFVDVTTSYRVDAKEAIDAIKRAGGIVIWAHPRKTEKVHNIDFTDILDRFIELGLDGIEVYNSIHNIEDANRYLKVCREKNLLISGGSDFHGEHVKERVRLGYIYKGEEKVKVDKDNILKLVNY